MEESLESSQSSSTESWLTLATVRPVGLSGAEPSWAWTGEKSMAIARAAMTASRTGNRRLSVRVNVVPPCAGAGVRDDARPVRRRQPMEAWRAG